MILPMLTLSKIAEAMRSSLNRSSPAAWISGYIWGRYLGATGLLTEAQAAPLCFTGNDGKDWGFQELSGLGIQH